MVDTIRNEATRKKHLPKTKVPQVHQPSTMPIKKKFPTEAVQFVHLKSNVKSYRKLGISNFLTQNKCS
jgi:hypothetical protein